MCMLIDSQSRDINLHANTPLRNKHIRRVSVKRLTELFFFNLFLHKQIIKSVQSCKWPMTTKPQK